MEDEAGTARTVYVVAGAEDLPLPDESVDLVICRDAIDRTLDPARAIGEIWRILRSDALLFLTVNLEGSPTPSEPVVLSAVSLASLFSPNFEIVTATHGLAPTSKKRVQSARVLARKKHETERALDRKEILAAYVALMNEESVGGF
jgi:ubiquinone/menaquinone biosynthesis C-methylase UbiE